MIIEDCKIFGSTPEDTSDDFRETLRLEFHYMGRLFIFCRPPIHLPNLRRLNFSLITGNEGPMSVKESIYPHSKHSRGLCVVRYDAEKHRSMKKEERYANILNLLKEGIQPYANHLGVDISFFHQTFRRMHAIGVHGSHFILDPVKSSKDRKHKASLEVESTENKCTFNILFLDKSNKIIERISTSSQIFYGASDNNALFSAIGRWRWLSNSEFALSNMHATWTWIASPYRDGFEFKGRGGYN